LPPREAAFAREQEWIGEVIQGRAELLDRGEKLLGGDAALSGLDRGDCLPVLEAEDTGKLVLRQLALLAQRLEPRANEVCGHCKGQAARGMTPPQRKTCLRVRTRQENV
jgi:hypothetical protein